MLNIAFCETNSARYTHIQSLLHSFSYRMPVRIWGFDRPLPFIAHIEQMGGDLDILISNIKMEEYNGIHLMQAVQSKFPHMEVIFVSEFLDLVFEAYAVRHAAFVPCPIETSYFMQGLDRAVANLHHFNKASITLANRGLISRLAFDDIIYFESNLRWLNVHTCAGCLQFAKQLESIKPLLDQRFIHCHKSFMVNMDYVVQMDVSSMTLFLHDGTAIPVSSRRCKLTKDAILSFMQQLP